MSVGGTRRLIGKKILKYKKNTTPGQPKRQAIFLCNDEDIHSFKQELAKGMNQGYSDGILDYCHSRYMSISELKYPVMNTRPLWGLQYFNFSKKIRQAQTQQEWQKEQLFKIPLFLSSRGCEAQQSLFIIRRILNLTTEQPTVSDPRQKKHLHPSPATPNTLMERT